MQYERIIVRGEDERLSVITVTRPIAL